MNQKILRLSADPTKLTLPPEYPGEGIRKNRTMLKPIDAARIEAALATVTDEKTFIQNLLIDTLNWPIDPRVQTVEEISYEWNERELRAAELSRHIVDGLIQQIVLPDCHWGVFIIAFKNPDVFTAERGMTGILRRVLRGLAPNLRKDATQPSWNRQNLLFICTHAYEHFRIAHFKAPVPPVPSPAEVASGEKTAGGGTGGTLARLATFGWGGGIPVRTACEFNLPYLAWPEDHKAFDGWATAFDVEKVTRKFYTEYKAVFESLEKSVTNLAGEDRKMFTQSLMNRLMFLRFIERKHWLHFPASAPAGDYLRDLFAAGPYQGQSFYVGRLQSLFFDGLAIEGRQESEAIGKVPFLNGGLFEKSALDLQVSDLPDSAFAPLLTPDGLFYRYNFTVQESTPLDIEVAVDPEMLGKVFEELVTGRHESGSYYTPRPVVSFMCREALKGYLSAAGALTGGNLNPQKTAGEGPGGTEEHDNAIAAFVDHHDTTAIDIPSARRISAALDDLKAVDPACGSGAYLLGLLHEMLELYKLLFSDKLKNDDRSLHELKLRIIEHNLYGVDVDEFATNIAMLRLWLSLSVDSIKPQPLPNLDFKIETGDSLTGPNPREFSDLRLHEPARQLAIIKGKYMRARGEEKKSLRRLIDNEQRGIAFELRSLCPGAIDWRVQFCEVFFSERGGFDVVLANPPYIRQELIKKSKPALKKVYKDHFSGTADLYVFFYLRALQLLARGGMLVFISSNKWFRAGYGLKLRSLIARTTSVRTIVDFHDLPVFESAIAYPMIFVAKNGLDSAATPTVLAEPPTLELPYPDVTAVVAKYGQRLPGSAFGSNGMWHLAPSATADRLKSMHNAGSTLGECVQGRVYRGLLTGLNEAWIDKNGKVYVKADKRPKDAVKHAVLVISKAKREELIAVDSRSDEIIKPLVTGKDLRRWRTEDLKKWMIVTKVGVDIERYPAILNHLTRFKSALQARLDQGRHWWELRACAYYESFENPKILYPVIAQRPTFTIGEAGSFCNDKCYLIDSDDRFLLAVLNSAPFWEFVKGRCSPLQGGFYEMRKNSIKQFPIPTASPTDRGTIAALAQKCLDAGGVGCEAFEKEIDERVAALYGL